ncbi:MAG: amino acid decarboxylase [Ruminococcaceae bacterium]|nr:amino acid decarboxylase [Oscillospiraceae bacterium]
MDSLLSFLQNYSLHGRIPMHMPGHKRASYLAPYLDILGAGLDVTEIDGLDDLHDADGILKAAMDRAAALWGSDRAFFLINGSTCGLLAGLYSLTAYGDEVLIARNCHKAVYHAVELRGLIPHYLVPPVDPGFGIHGSVSPADVAAALDAHPGVRLCVLTSPSYEGVLSDVAAIADICHAHGVPLLIDEAHGAHLGLTPEFPASAVSQGADIVIQSVHKTLPSLTQTAIAHAKAPYADAFARALGIFQTSSPSYLLMASIDGCVGLLTRDREPLFAAWRQRLERFRERMTSLRVLRILPYGAQPPLFFDREPSKLVISCAGSQITGTELADRLRLHNIECEMASASYIIAMTGVGDSDDMMDAFAAALLEIDASLTADAAPARPVYPSLPEQICPIAEALAAPREICSLEGAIGRVSAGYLWAYPPGIPLIVPGEAVSREIVTAIEHLQACGISLKNPGIPENAGLAVMI